FDPDLHVLPPKWGDVQVAAPRPTSPHIEVKTFSMVLEGGQWNVYVGYDPTTCKPRDATPVGVQFKPEYLQSAGPGKNSEANLYLTRLVEKAMNIEFRGGGIVAHIYTKVNSTCWAFAVAYVTTVPQGNTKAYVDSVSVASNTGKGYWYFPAGGISKSRFSAEFDLTFMTSKGQVKSGTEGVEIVPAMDFDTSCDNGQCYVKVDPLKDLFTWFAVKSGSWPFVYMALDENKKDKLKPLERKLLTPMASITFGDTPYVYKTPIGDLTIPKEVIPNIYGIWPDHVGYYLASFSSAVPQINSYTPSYTPSPAVLNVRALEFWLGNKETGTVLRNLGKHNKDGITSVSISDYGDVSTL
ncbi:MAG: hypothetical protein ACPL3C_13115, partial [Pyrobaculum sp.]